MSTAEVKEELPVDPEGIAGGLEDLFQNKLPCLVPRAGTYMGFRTPTIEDIAWVGSYTIHLTDPYYISLHTSSE